MLYAAYQASGGRLRLPHYTGDQIRLGLGIPWLNKMPGDLIFFSYPGAGRPHHVAIYVGGNKILHAPHTGDVVRYGTIGEFSGQLPSHARRNWMSSARPVSDCARPRRQPHRRRVQAA